MGDGECWVHLDVQVHAEMTEAQKQTDGRAEKKGGGGLKRKGAEERENFIREEVRGLDGEGKIRDD